MGEALVDLELAVREGNFTSKEANLFMQMRARCVRDFTLGLTGGALVTWLAGKRLPKILRINLTAGAGFASGMWRFWEAADNCVQHILSMEGTRMQKELGERMLKKYQYDPLIMQRVSKFFYSEEVYNDASDRPQLRWRYRNFFSDSYHETSDQNKTTPKTTETSDQKGVVGLKKIVQDRKQEQMNAVVDATENPLTAFLDFQEEPKRFLIPTHPENHLQGLLVVINDPSVGIGGITRRLLIMLEAHNVGFSCTS